MAFLSALASFTPQLVGGLGAYKAANMKTKKTPVVPMPDEEEIRRTKRRKPSSAGRASTILTGTDYGLGG